MDYLESLYRSFDEPTRKTLESGEYRRLLEGSLPPPSHPQYRTWLLYGLTGILRGRECGTALEEFISLKGSRMLDFGCGEGGIAVALTQAGASVTAIDVDESRVRRTEALARDFELSVDARLSTDYGAELESASFDAVVCNDVIEHVESREALAESHARLLRDEGVLYLTVPNRFSLRALRSDGHYGLPGLSLMSRGGGEWYVTRLARRADTYTLNRLLGWKEVHRLYRRVGIDLRCISDRGIVERLRRRLGSRSTIPLRADSRSERMAVGLIRLVIQEFWTFIGTRRRGARETDRPGTRGRP
ncbi:MAG: methyltransferase domain-containing protein [Candidatus Eisenbacteria bacterium]